MGLGTRAIAKTPRKAPRPNTMRLTELIEQATTDAYGELEQATGWFMMFEEHLQFPFATTVLGTTVNVVSIDLRDDGQIVAICARGRDRQAIPVLDLPLPPRGPDGWERVEACRHWLRK